MTRRARRCIPCAAFLLGLLAMLWTAGAWAQSGGSFAGLPPEAIFGALITVALFVVSGYTARTDRDMRDLAKLMREQFGAVATEQRQQQTQINLLTERFGDRPSRQELNDLRLELGSRFDRMEDLIRERR